MDRHRRARTVAADTTDVRHEHDDAGFSLIEQVIAMVVIAGALLGLLVTLGATAQSVNTSRQRTVAISLAKQVIEHSQGAAYTSVATNLASVGGDALVSGTAPNLYFAGERLVPGGTEPYRTTTTSTGTTFALRTFVTAVPAAGGDYRRVTVIVDWPATAPAHSMRFASFVYPLDYATYPASTAEAEAFGAAVTLTGSLADDTFEVGRLLLPGVRVDTSASTLRTSLASASSGSSYLDLVSGSVSSLACETPGSDVGECVRTTVDAVADNDSSSSASNWAARLGQPFQAGGLSAPGGTNLVVPAGVMTARSSTDACGPCGFGDADGLPWADVSLSTTSASTGTFASDHGAGVLHGRLWSTSGAWTVQASLDHDATGGGLVTATAQLTTPSVTLLGLDAAPPGYEGAVLVEPFSARVSATSGYGATAPDTATSTTARQLQVWSDAGYQTVTVAANAAVDTTVTGSVQVDDHVVSYVARVQSQSSSVSVAGAAPTTDATAQHPSMLVVTLDVTITSTSRQVVTDQFTLVFDYGRVSGHDTWLMEAA